MTVQTLSAAEDAPRPTDADPGAVDIVLAEPEEAIAAIAPNLQRYVSGDLSAQTHQTQ